MVWESGRPGICDGPGSPGTAQKPGEDTLDTKGLDRTMIILDIFAARARTREGKIQVELAQLRYRAVRLVGLQKFSVETRRRNRHEGPGETRTRGGPQTDP